MLLCYSGYINLVIVLLYLFLFFIKQKFMFIFLLTKIYVYFYFRSFTCKHGCFRCYLLIEI